MLEDRNKFECTVLTKKILKAAKKSGLKRFFKEAFEFKSQYYIGIEKYEWGKILFIECLNEGFYRIPLKKSGWDHLTDPDQAPDRKAINILKDLYVFLKA